ncbi:MAG TPA: serine protease [Gemmatimonadaceae bacterium]|nr:serine protease [Gemmatimonadaceae bacterium]
MSNCAVVGLVVVLLASGDWSAIVKPAAKHVARLEILQDGEDAPGICTGVVINRAAGFVLTAAHCVEGHPNISLTVNGRHAIVAKTNRLLDLAVVRTTLRDETQITFAPASPEVGAEAAVLGFAFGVEQMAAQFGRVSQTFNGETKLLWLNLDLIFGDSGGPAIDAAGRLIGINSRVYSKGPAHMAAVVPVETVRGFVEAYLPGTASQ